MFDQLINLVPTGLHTIPSNFAYLAKKVLLAISDVNVRNAPGTNSTVLFSAKKTEKVGITTGRVYKFENGTTVWIEVTTPSNKLGWVSAMLVTLPESELSKQAESLLNSIISIDVATYNNIVVANALLVKAEKSGKNISSEKSRIYKVTGSWQKRQNEIADASFLKVTYNAITDQLKKYINKLIGGGLGEPVTITILGIAVAVKYIIAAAIIVGSAITYAVIKYLQTSKDEATIEFNESKKVISDILNKLDEKERATLTDEINQQLSDAYTDGRKAQWWDSTGSLVKNILLISVGVLLVTNVLPSAFSRTQNKYK